MRLRAWELSWFVKGQFRRVSTEAGCTSMNRLSLPATISHSRYWMWCLSWRGTLLCLVQQLWKTFSRTGFLQPLAILSKQISKWWCSQVIDWKQPWMLPLIARCSIQVHRSSELSRQVSRTLWTIWRWFSRAFTSWNVSEERHLNRTSHTLTTQLYSLETPSSKFSRAKG